MSIVGRLCTVLAAVLAGGLAPAGALADVPVVLSAGPERVAVTLYRDPERGDRAIDRQMPGAFALIAETRVIDLPPGVVTVRFEGVAGGIVPQSAILFGAAPRERNRDAALLSQAGLVDAYTGQQVIVRRTNRATGQVVEERATVRSAADRLVIAGPRGAEAVTCSGAAQTLLYPGVPATLSAKPVLTMTTADQPGGRVTVTLAYLATGFDWDATYVGTLAADGDTLELFAWLTMASGDETSFVAATTSAVAGRVGRSEDTRDDAAAEARRRARWVNRMSRCWPAGTTSDVHPVPSPPPVAMALEMAMPGEDIVVTGQRVQRALSAPIAVTATAESLADLKLYRIPVPVTVGARSQKQVAFLADRRVRGMLVHRARATWGEPDTPELLFRFRNRSRDRLGEPLPAGRVVLFQNGSAERHLVGESTLTDKSIDEEVELVFGEARAVTLDTDEQQIDDGIRYAVTIRNANPFPIRFELEFAGDTDRIVRGLPGGTIGKPGKRVWVATVPANAERRLRYDFIDSSTAD